MAGTGFQIEGAFQAGGRGCVVARVLDPNATFEVTSASTLGGCSVEQWLEIPRASDANGAPRLDLFAFCLKSLADIEHFAVGLHVELI